MSGEQLEAKFKVIEELYDKYKHMNSFLSAEVPGDSFDMFVLKDFWLNIAFVVESYRRDKVRSRG